MTIEFAFYLGIALGIFIKIVWDNPQKVKEWVGIFKKKKEEYNHATTQTMR